MEFFHHIHCKYTGVKGFITVYNHAIKYRYMITEKTKRKAKILIFWEKHGLEATLDAFPVKRSTLYLWKQQWERGNKKIEALNDKSKAPRTKRKRLWPLPIIEEINKKSMLILILLALGVIFFIGHPLNGGGLALFLFDPLGALVCRARRVTRQESARDPREAVTARALNMPVPERPREAVIAQYNQFVIYYIKKL